MLRALLILFSLGLAMLFYASVIERNWFALRAHRVPALPPGATPLRIVHISDLHLRARQRHKQRFIRRLNRLEPDFVVGTGDFLGDAHAVPATVEAMDAIGASRARLFVMGSNDYYGPTLKNPLRYFRKRRGSHAAGKPNPWEDMVEALTARGWLDMSNRAERIDEVDVVGLDDAHIGRADESVATARAGDGLRLALTHSPDAAPGLAARGYDLILCGHTHGGQIRVPGYGALVTNCTLPRPMARGLHRLDGAWLHVCAGLGTSMYAPIRLACRPEACVLDLVPAGT